MLVTTAGESHGKGLICIVEDVPAGVALAQDDFDTQLARRQAGYGRGGRMAIERDSVQVMSGIRHGVSTGSPIALFIPNRDFANHAAVMDAFGDPDVTSFEPLSKPRPNHADLPGALKLGITDCRDVIERSSARGTAARVAASVVARALLEQLGVHVGSQVESIGGMEGDDASPQVRERIDAAAAAGESLGGIIRVQATGLLPGLGEFADRSQALDSLIAAAMLSIPGIKGVEFGDGFALAAMEGSRAADAITAQGRSSNHMGGIEGGMSTGEPIVLRIVMKPIPSLRTPVATIDLESGEPAQAQRIRADVCAVPAAAVVAEAELALVLASAYQRQFGHASLADLQANVAAYATRLSPHWRRD
ncbi:MAG: chorismate synthase [Coriobacteriales bacterium]|nr:chorismate synthase [Coriobacteriales bacterium]